MARTRICFVPNPMTQLLRFSGAVKRAPTIAAWMTAHAGELGVMAQRWSEVMCKVGHEVREVWHDGHPTACVGDAGFACVNAFTAHVNGGFFRGATCPRRLTGRADRRFQPARGFACRGPWAHVALVCASNHGAPNRYRARRRLDAHLESGLGCPILSRAVLNPCA